MTATLSLHPQSKYIRHRFLTADYNVSSNFQLLLCCKNFKTMLFTILNTTKNGTVEIKARYVCSQVQEQPCFSPHLELLAVLLRQL